MRKAAISVLFLGLFLLPACYHKPTDEEISKTIEQKAAADPDTKDSNFTAEAKRGSVTLRGTVKSVLAKKELAKIANAEPGVNNLDDQTTIDDGSSATNVVVPPAKPSAKTATIHAATIAPHATTTAPKPSAQTGGLTVPAGTVLTVRLGQALGSKTSSSGEIFAASLAEPVSVDGKVVIPAGATASGTVTEAKAAGRFKGGAVLGVTLKTIVVNGHTYRIQTIPVDRTSKGKGKRTAAMVGGGAGGGALFGGIFGGGKGAGIGALLGAGAGTVGAAFTGKRDIILPAEMALSFKLERALPLGP